MNDFLTAYTYSTIVICIGNIIVANEQILYDDMYNFINVCANKELKISLIDNMCVCS